VRLPEWPVCCDCCQRLVSTRENTFQRDAVVERQIRIDDREWLTSPNYTRIGRGGCSSQRRSVGGCCVHVIQFCGVSAVRVCHGSCFAITRLLRNHCM